VKSEIRLDQLPNDLFELDAYRGLVGASRVALLEFFVRPFEDRSAFPFRQFAIDCTVGRQPIVVEFHKVFVRPDLNFALSVIKNIKPNDQL
jgi:hypothetical protein